MRYIKYYLVLMLLIPSLAQAAAPTRPSGSVAVSNAVISSTAYNSDLNTIYNYLQAGVDTYAAGSITNASVSASAAISASKLSLGGVVLPSGAVFYMITGSCPSGTTDVSATYSNKFIKINATAGTSSGVILTGTTDSTTLTAAQSGLPAHTHDVSLTNGAGGSKMVDWVDGNAEGFTATAAAKSTGGTPAASGHTHTFSTATTLEPVSVTAVLCQVS